jgi:hypothetical protein
LAVVAGAPGVTGHRASEVYGVADRRVQTWWTAGHPGFSPVREGPDTRYRVPELKNWSWMKVGRVIAVCRQWCLT